jgi:hypothetical protein
MLALLGTVRVRDEVKETSCETKESSGVDEEPSNVARRPFPVIGSAMIRNWIVPAQRKGFWERIKLIQ